MSNDAVLPLRGAGTLTWFTRRKPDVVAAAALFLLPFVVRGRALRPGWVLSPGDIVLVFPPWSVLAPGLRVANSLLTDQSELHQYSTTRDRAANVRLVQLVSEVLGAIEAGVSHPVVGWQCKELPVQEQVRGLAVRR